MAKKAKKIAKKEPEKINKWQKIVLWRWIIILIPLIIAIMWAISILSVYNEIPIVYEEASPSSVNSLLFLVFFFIATYGTFIFMRFKKTLE